MRNSQIETDYFSPSAVQKKSALFGRDDVLDDVVNIINEKQYHVVIAGERGVGKSSLLKTSAGEVNGKKDKVGGVFLEIKCTGFDDFINVCDELYTALNIADPPERSTPNDVIKILQSKDVFGHMIVDEFEVAEDRDKALITQLCKHIGELGLKFTFCFCEAIDIPDYFYIAHASIRRYIRRIDLSGIDSEYTSELVNNALKLNGCHPLEPDEEAVLYYVTQGIPYRIKQLGKHLLEVLNESESRKLTSELLVNFSRRTLEYHYKQEFKTLVNIFEDREIGDVAKRFLSIASNVSLNSFIDYNEIYKQLYIEMEPGEINKNNYLRMISELCKDYNIFGRNKNKAAKHEIYFKDYSYPFVVRLLEQI